MTAQNPFDWMNAPIYEPTPIPVPHHIQRRRRLFWRAFAVVTVLGMVVSAMWGLSHT